QADVSLGLSDLATLSLVDPNSPPIHDYFYNQRSLGVQTTTPLLNSMDDYNALTQAAIVAGAGMGSGGGKGGGELGVVTVRREFPDTAFWQADLLTDKDGKATVSVKLPDNLTTWRLDARAITKDTYAGQATLDLLATKPLMVEPTTPRFFVAGDQATLGAVVHNNTTNPLETQVELQAKGFEVLDDLVKTIQIPAGQQAYVTWNGKVPFESERVDLIFSAKAGDLSDASKPTLATLPDQGILVLHYLSPETVATAGSLKEKGTRQELVQLPQNYDQPGGTLTIRLSPSLAAGMLDGLTFLENYPYDCIEQTVSRFLPNLSSMQAFRAAGINDPQKQTKLDTLVQTTLQRIYNRQNPDGGWGWWDSEKSDLQTSAYVILGLTEAKKDGYAVDQDSYNRGVEFLKTNLMDPNTIHESYQFNQLAFVLYVLDRANSGDSAIMGKLYGLRERLAIYAKAFLAHALYQANAQDTRVKTLLSDLQNQAVTSATGISWHEKDTESYSWNSDTRTTAIVLAMLNDIDPTNPLNENIVRWLMQARMDDHWRSTQENSWTIMALAGWLEKSGELKGSYGYSLTLNDKQLGEWKSQSGNNAQTTEIVVAVRDLLKNEANKLIFNKDNSEGTLYYTMHLKLPLPVNEIEPLDRGIIVTRDYFKADNPNQSISEVHKGDIVYGRVTVVVPNDVYYLVVEDALPAGLEAIDQSLLTSSHSEQPQQYNWKESELKGWGWWYFNHVELRDEKVVLSAEYLPAGTYRYTYIARAATIGDFQTIPPLAYEFYFPEVFGRGSGMTFRVLP
ncbi:MAG: alpha-2-macroglobulin family protein, partial [Anaerolineales bacterium]